MPEVKHRKGGGTYVHYSDDEIQSAKSISMIDFLGREYGYTFERVGGYYRGKEHDSLMISRDERSWWWNSQNLQGRNVFDWLLQVENYKYNDVLEKLIGSPDMPVYENQKALSYSSAPKSNEILIQKEIDVPKKADGKPGKAFAYLLKTRCIDPDIVSQLFHEKLIYQDVHGNVVFVGKDENDEIKFCERKITNTFLADKRDKNGKKVFTPMNVSGSDKRYSFNVSYDNKAFPAAEGVLYVFEAPVDLLSHATFRMLNEKKRAEKFGDKPNLNAWRNVNRLSLSGVSVTALDSYLERNPQINMIVFCLDNDHAGIDAATKYEKLYTERGYECKKLRPERGKDWNEYLQIRTAELSECKSIENTNAALQQVADNVYYPPKGGGRK